MAEQVKAEKKSVKFYADSAYSIHKAGIKFELEGEYHELPHQDVYSYTTDKPAEIDRLKRMKFPTDHKDIINARNDKIAANLKKVKSLKTKTEAGNVA